MQFVEGKARHDIIDYYSFSYSDIVKIQMMKSTDKLFCLFRTGKDNNDLSDCAQ